MATDAQREALARIIDTETWKVTDDPWWEAHPDLRRDARGPSLKKAAEIIESGLMAAYEWDRREYVKAKQRILACTSRRGHCYNVSDLLDGYYKHDPRCPHWPEGAVGGSDCIQER